MKILIIGATGTIGRKVSEELARKNELIKVGKTSGDIQADISNLASIEKIFEKSGKVDAIVCIAGEAKWNDFKKL